MQGRNIIGQEVPLKDIRILAEDGGQFFRVGKVAAIDSGYGLMVFTEAPGRKQSIHSDGSHWDRVVELASTGQPIASRPPSETTLRTVTSVTIPSDLTYRSRPFQGDVTDALVFPAQHVATGCSLVAQIAGPEHLDECVRLWQVGDYASSIQTIQPFAGDRALVVTIQPLPASSSSTMSSSWRSTA